MTRLPAPATTITVTCKPAFHPRHLIWGRQRYVVDQIIDVWRVDTDWWKDSEPISRHYISLTTKTGAMLIIYYDLLNKEWLLDRAYD